MLSIVHYRHRGIIQEFNLGVGSHVSITLWCKLCSWGGGGRGRAVSPPPPILLYITSRIAHMEYLFCWQLILIFLCFKLGVQTKHALAWMFFCTLATAFSTSHCLETVCSCWVWKLTNDVCPLNLEHRVIGWRRKLINCSVLGKKPWEWGWWPLRPWSDAMLLAMRKWVQKHSILY